jgi:hypothetical protein
MDAATKAYVDAAITAALAQYGDGDTMEYGNATYPITGLGQSDLATLLQ